MYASYSPRPRRRTLRSLFYGRQLHSLFLGLRPPLMPRFARRLRPLELAVSLLVLVAWNTNRSCLQRRLLKPYFVSNWIIWLHPVTPLSVFLLFCILWLCDTASDRQRLYGNTFERSGDRQRSTAIIWKHFSAIGWSSAIVSDYMETLFSDRAIVGDRERSYASVNPAIRRSWTKSYGNRAYTLDSHQNWCRGISKNSNVPMLELFWKTNKYKKNLISCQINNC